MNKKILLYICLASVVAASSCTKKFDAVNTDPTQVDSAQIDPNLLLASAQIEYFNATMGNSGAQLLQSMWVQILASAEYPTYYSNGDKYVASGNLTSYQASLWTHCYNSATYAYECMNLAKAKGQTNLSGEALIMQLLDFMSITDIYGDCPYSQAVLGKSGLTLPVYDAQQSIYASMLSKLDSVIPTLDETQVLPTDDLFPYKGDAAKWKKFGYSLMLRMAMRLTKADVVTAQKYAEKAYAGGTFGGTADDAWVTFDHADGYNNNNTSAWQVPEDFSEVHWGKQLISYLKSTNDPRVSVIAEVPKPGTKAAANENLMGDTTYADQLGMPNGYDQNGGATDISKAPGYPGYSYLLTDTNVVGLYSRPAIGEYISLNTPAFAINYAETELLLAEAAARGWNVGSNAATHYANGVTAALQSYAILNSTYGTIPAAVITAYVTAHPLDVSSQANSLAQINTQYWATTGTLLDYNEAWSNWRRSGIPALTPVNYPGNFTQGTIPRRQAYPPSEASTNPNNYQAAVSALGGSDNFTSHVWWDK